MKKEYYKPDICVVVMGKEFMQYDGHVSQGKDTDEPDSNKNNLFDEQEENGSTSAIWDTSTEK